MCEKIYHDFPPPKRLFRYETPLPRKLENIAYLLLHERDLCSHHVARLRSDTSFQHWSVNSRACTDFSTGFQSTAVKRGEFVRETAGFRGPRVQNKNRSKGGSCRCQHRGPTANTVPAPTGRKIGIMMPIPYFQDPLARRSGPRASSIQEIRVVHDACEFAL